MTTIEQQNAYKILDSMGRPTSIYYVASNIKEAYAAFKADKVNFQKYYYGKLVRTYNGGIKG